MNIPSHKEDRAEELYLDFLPKYERLLDGYDPEALFLLMETFHANRELVQLMGEKMEAKLKASGESWRTLRERMWGE